MEKAGIGVEAVDAAVYDVQPRALLRRSIHLSGGTAYRDPSALVEQSLSGADEFRERIRSLQRLRQLLNDPAKVISIDHQLAHAASAFYPSGFDRAAIIVLSGRSDYVSIAVGIGEKEKVRIIDRVLFPHSLGWVYTQLTQHLGFGAVGEENKTRWLSLSGEPEFLHAFQELIRIDSRGFPSVNGAYFNFSQPKADPLSSMFYEKFGHRSQSRDEGLMDWGKRSVWIEAVSRKAGLTTAGKVTGKGQLDESYRCNMACSLQQRLEKVVLALADSVRQRVQADALCVAGGVALNSLLVSRLERDSGFKYVFVQPAAGNAGCSIGGPLYLWHKKSRLPSSEPWRHAFFGPDYSDRDVKPVLENCKLPYRYIDTAEKLVAELVELLCSGKIVAWFQGPAEFGARSLGARSILASPLQEYVKENLNVYIKHRELFRPFAASVTEERAGEFFENPGPLSQFLLSVSRIRSDQRDRLPGVWFADGLARVHTVNRRSHPLFWKLLDRFGQKTGVPILINTSFNLFGEPLVCSPRDAVRSFYCSGIDALAINHFLLQK